jgi:hypothetical protein
MGNIAEKCELRNTQIIIVCLKNYAENLPINTAIMYNLIWK